MSCSTSNFLFILLITAIAVITGPTLIHGANKEMAHIHLYMHDQLTGPDPTSIPVVNGSKMIPNVPNLNFGEIFVFDDPLTEGPTANSSLLGRGQGSYTSVAMNEPVFMFAMNVFLTAGEYNGSSVSIMGRDDVSLTVREWSVVGGTGQFRMARGYVTFRVFWLNYTTGDGVFEMDIYAKKATKAN